MMGTSANAPRSISMASVNSEGSTETASEQPEFGTLTQNVVSFKHSLAKFRKALDLGQSSEELDDTMQVAVHDRTKEVLTILKCMFEKYPALRSQELIAAAGNFVREAKGISFYSCENLAPDAEPGVMTAIVHGLADDRKAEEETAACLEVDGLLMRLEQGVDFALQHAKLWSKYAKDLMMYVEKRAHLEIEFNKNLKKLAMTVRPLINEEPLNTQRAEHERTRKYLKETWYKELAKMQKVFSNLQRVHHSYIKTQQDWDQFHEDCLEQSMQGGKYERKKALEEEAMQKLCYVSLFESYIQAVEAEVAYKTAISQANDSHAQMLKVKADILKSIREQMKKSDKVLQAVTVDYFQIEQALTKALPVQFRSFSESSQLYEPGSQYMEFVKRLSIPLVSPMQEPFSFEPYSKTAHKLLELERKSTDSVKCDDVYRVKGTCNMKVMQGASFGSDTDSIASSQSNKSHEPSPTRKCKVKCHWKCLDHMIIMCEAKVPPVEQAANLDVPLALTKCIEAIEAHGKFEKGIYRISGVTSTVKKVITQLKEHPNLVDLSETLPRVVSDVLKLFLREYPEPILPFSMYDDFIRGGRSTCANVLYTLAKIELKTPLTKPLQTACRAVMQTKRTKMYFQEVTSDEEQSYLLLPDDLAGSSGLSLETSHRVFEGSLKDYQGLEGVCI
ncbi:hypothetical protein C0J52_10686 [Blattella germanica]|nr:hypothetical protein C0J52_10686 [Blattella germanica]